MNAESPPSSSSPSEASHRWVGRIAVVAIFISSGVFVLSDAYVCPFFGVSGVPCPGCGLTRAGFALLEGDFGEASRMNPLIFAILPLALWAGAAMLRSAPGRVGELASRLPSPPLWPFVAAAVALVGLWVVRLTGALGGLPYP